VSGTEKASPIDIGTGLPSAHALVFDRDIPAGPGLARKP
jgi:hypothetical protein